MVKMIISIFGFKKLNNSKVFMFVNLIFVCRGVFKFYVYYIC